MVDLLRTSGFALALLLALAACGRGREEGPRTEPEARALLDLLFYDPPGDEAVAARLEAMRAQPQYRELFPAPRQRWVDALSLSQARLRSGAPAEDPSPICGTHCFWFPS